MDRKRHHKNELQTTTREAGAEGQRPATAGNTYTSSAARGAAGGRRQPLVGVATPVSRQRPLGRPLSARAGRVAKEMTAPSAAPRRAAAAGRGLERRRFRFRSLSAPVPLPPPGRPRAFHRHLASPRRRASSCYARPRGSRLRRRHGSRLAQLTLEAAGQLPPWVPTFPSPTR